MGQKLKMADSSSARTAGCTQHLGGQRVTFPYEPYGPQNVFMSKLITALTKQQNALLEAPTGSGKTLCLLCALLAWQQTIKTQITEAQRNKYAAAEAQGLDRPPDSAEVDGIPDRSCELDDDMPQDKKPKVPVIYYATRTHSQITQVVSELKKTPYKPKVANLASRKHYCINKKVIKSGRIDEQCDELLREDYGCKFHKAGRPQAIPVAEVHDIEELVAAGKKAKTCPYYASRALAEEAELVLCPYQYLVDPSIREALGIDIRNAVLVFDEAHNIEDTAREAGSLDVELGKLFEVYEALRYGKDFSSKPEPYQVLHRGIENVMVWLKGISESSIMKPAEGRAGEKRAIIIQPQQILGHLNQAGLGPADITVLQRAHKQAKEYENSKKAAFTTDSEVEIPANVKHVGAGSGALGFITGLLAVLQLLHGMKGLTAGGKGNMMDEQDDHEGDDYDDDKENKEGEEEEEGLQDLDSEKKGQQQRKQSQMNKQLQPLENRASDYRLVISSSPGVVVNDDAHGSDDDATQTNARHRRRGVTQRAGEDVVTMGLWCMSPSVSFQALSAGSRSVVLTSGTLAPLRSFASELGTQFDITHEGRHVVDVNTQVWAGVLCKGPTGMELQSVYNAKNNTAHHDELGKSLLEISDVVPHGMLVFFPSYGLMESLISHWKGTGLWSELREKKQLVVEPRDTGNGFEVAMKKHKDTIAKGRGSLLMAVCRGKASEGIDFRDAQARAVVLIGIPYPAARDTKVLLKKTYNDGQRHAYNAKQRTMGNGGNNQQHRPLQPKQGQQQGVIRGQPLAGSLNTTDTQGGGNAATAPQPEPLSGEQWYQLQAFRALNQAIGRCIRHKHDHGAVIFLDVRFSREDYINQLPAWIKRNVQVHRNCSTGISQLQAFFHKMKECTHQPGATATPAATTLHTPNPSPIMSPAVDTAADLQPAGYMPQPSNAGGTQQGIHNQVVESCSMARHQSMSGVLAQQDITMQHQQQPRQTNQHNTAMHATRHDTSAFNSQNFSPYASQMPFPSATQAFGGGFEAATQAAADRDTRQGGASMTQQHDGQQGWNVNMAASQWQYNRELMHRQEHTHQQQQQAPGHMDTNHASVPFHDTSGENRHHGNRHHNVPQFSACAMNGKENFGGMGPSQNQSWKLPMKRPWLHDVPNNQPYVCIKQAMPTVKQEQVVSAASGPVQWQQNQDDCTTAGPCSNSTQGASQWQQSHQPATNNYQQCSQPIQNHQWHEHKETSTTWQQSRQQTQHGWKPTSPAHSQWSAYQQQNSTQVAMQQHRVAHVSQYSDDSPAPSLRPSIHGSTHRHRPYIPGGIPATVEQQQSVLHGWQHGHSMHSTHHNHNGHATMPTPGQQRSTTPNQGYGDQTADQATQGCGRQHAMSSQHSQQLQQQQQQHMLSPYQSQQQQQQQHGYTSEPSADFRQQPRLAQEPVQTPTHTLGHISLYDLEHPVKYNLEGSKTTIPLQANSHRQFNSMHTGLQSQHRPRCLIYPHNEDGSRWPLHPVQQQRNETAACHAGSIAQDQLPSHTGSSCAAPLGILRNITGPLNDATPAPTASSIGVQSSMQQHVSQKPSCHLTGGDNLSTPHQDKVTQPTPYSYNGVASEQAKTSSATLFSRFAFTKAQSITPPHLMQ